MALQVVLKNNTTQADVPTLIGLSDAAIALFAEIDRCARTSARVLITGETGTGKELLAAEIHRRGARAQRPFVALNCAGLAETLLESELFGHVKGSFTGAYRDKPGKFELAHNGTLFLDEVGEMSLRMQGMLLRVLETGEVQKVGADRVTTRVDVRVIGATHRDLAALVANGSFREDLYYRLNVLHVRVPPLRERQGDVRALADHFLARQAREYGPLRFAPDAYAALEAYHWPGNIRQLENVVQRAIVHCTGDVITALDLPAEIRTAAPAQPEAKAWTPFKERRRSVGSKLYAQMRATGSNFWQAVHAPYLAHDLTRNDVIEVVRLALTESHGHYTVAAQLLNLPRSDYKRFLSFLRKHKCLLEYRPFRQGAAAVRLVGAPQPLESRINASA